MLYILKLLSKIVVKLIYNEFEPRRERTKNVSVQKSNSNPVGLNLQTHMQSVPITTCYEFESRSWRGVLDTTLYVIVCQRLWESLRVLQFPPQKITTTI